MDRIVSILVFFMMISNVTIAQEKSFATAAQASASGNYVDAISIYKKTLNNITDPIRRQETFYNIGISYLKMNRYAEALPWLRDAVHSNSPYVEHYFSYAEALTYLGKVDKAVEIYKKVLKQYPNNEYAYQKLHALECFEKELPRVIKVKQQSKINSFSSDYSPAWYGDNIVFSSTRTGKYKHENKRTAQAYSDLYIASYNGATEEWENPVAFDALNSKYSEGVFAYDNLFHSAFVMRCFNKNRDCKIMVASKNNDDTWSKLKEVSFEGRQKIGHPAISSDGNRLYFVSDMKGGYGGKDIWVISRIEKEVWGMPQNLGPSVNSADDEVFPSVVGDSLLFFASNRTGSIGGLDVYLSKIDGDKYNQAVHLQYPINSTADDFSLIWNNKGGLFTSNRENEARSDDIYSFKGFPLQIILHGVVYDKENSGVIPNASVVLNFRNMTSQLSTDSLGRFTVAVPVYTKGKIFIACDNYKDYSTELYLNDKRLLYDAKDVYEDYYLVPPQPLATISGYVTDRESNEPIVNQLVEISGSRGFKTSVKTNQEGKYVFNDLLPKRIYVVKIKKEGYFSDSRRCTIPKLVTSMMFNTDTGYDMDFQLTEIQQKKEVVIRNIFYDFNKATLRPESRNELRNLVSMLQETPNVIIQINSHTDTRGRADYNLRLSQRRAQSVVDYLTQHGISSDRLFAKGYGETQPVVVNATTDDEHQLNRRTSFRVLAVLEKASSKMPDIKYDQQELSKKTVEENNTPANIVDLSASIKKNSSAIIYRIQLFSSSKRINADKKFFVLINNTTNTKLIENKVGGLYKYEIGERYTYADAVILRTKIVSLGHKDCFITAYKNGDKISVNVAKREENK